jgi:hypothetical protein
MNKVVNKNLLAGEKASIACGCRSPVVAVFKTHGLPRSILYQPYGGVRKARSNWYDSTMVHRTEHRSVLNAIFENNNETNLHGSSTDSKHCLEFLLG